VTEDECKVSYRRKILRIPSYDDWCLINIFFTVSLRHLGQIGYHIRDGQA
jgi:hypothetical protein